MNDETPRADINMAKIPVGGGFAGLIFAVGTMAVFVIGIPSIRYMLPASLVLGCGVALALRCRREAPRKESGLSILVP